MLLAASPLADYSALIFIFIWSTDKNGCWTIQLLLYFQVYYYW